MAVGSDSDKGLTLQNASAARTMPSAERRAPSAERRAPSAERRAPSAEIAPRVREQRRPAAPPDRRPARRGGGSSPCTHFASAAGRPADPARLYGPRRGLVRSARALAAAALLALSGALALPATAHADVLVSNIGQADSFAIASDLNDVFYLGQAFSVGADGGNYTLTSIEIPFRNAGIAAADIGSLSVSVWSTGSSGFPSALLHTLMKPASITAGTTVTFNAQAGATLEAGTTYAVVVYFDKDLPTDPPGWALTGSGEDANPAMGWEIADSRMSRSASGTTWSNSSSTSLYKIRVNGTAAGGGTPNSAPEFSVELAVFTVPENSAADTVVGTVTATDDNNDTLTYSLEGTDAGSFDIDSGTGEIKTKAGVTYNYEAKFDYEMTAKADDGNGGSDTIDVNIALLDDDTEKSAEPAKPRLAAVPGSPTTLTATWTKPGLNGGPDITGYKLEYRESSGNWQNFAHSGTGVTATLTGLTANTGVPGAGAGGERRDGKRLVGSLRPGEHRRSRSPHSHLRGGRVRAAVGGHLPLARDDRVHGVVQRAGAS